MMDAHTALAQLVGHPELFLAANALQIKGYPEDHVPFKAHTVEFLFEKRLVGKRWGFDEKGKAWDDKTVDTVHGGSLFKLSQNIPCVIPDIESRKYESQASLPIARISNYSNNNSNNNNNLNNSSINQDFVKEKQLVKKGNKAKRSSINIGEGPYGIKVRAYSIPMLQLDSFKIEDLTSLDWFGVPSTANDGDMVVTGGLSACSFCFIELGGSLLCTHLRPTEAMGGRELEKRLKEFGRFKDRPEPLRVFGLGSYLTSHAATVIGVKHNAKWHLYAQETDSLCTTVSALHRLHPAPFATIGLGAGGGSSSLRG